MATYPGYYPNNFGANYVPQNNYGIPFNQVGYQAYPPMYQNGYQQNQNQQAPQIQPQNPPDSRGFYGKVISRPEDFAPNDVFMDGSKGYFPMSDGSCIYVKYWKPDGTIGTDRYIPENVAGQEKPNPFAEALKAIDERLSKIEKTLTE